MGQDEVIEVLKKEPNKWVTSLEVSKMLGISQSSSTALLSRLRRDGCVEMKKTMDFDLKRIIYKHRLTPYGVRE